MLWIRIPILKTFIVPETAQWHHFSPTYYTLSIWMFAFNTLGFFAHSYEEMSRLDAFFWPQLSVVRQACRNLSPDMLAGLAPEVPVTPSKQSRFYLYQSYVCPFVKWNPP